MSSGGGIYLKSSAPSISKCIIRSNISSGGAGLGLYTSSPTITNCFIVSNCTNYSNGGGISCYSSSPTITNCTISDNSVSTMPSGFGVGGGINCLETSSPTVLNSIVWGNCAGIIATDEIYLSENSSINIPYSDIKGGWDGSGNIDADPLYIKSSDNVPDYHLTASSPCIDKGTSLGAPTDDIDNDPRPQGASFDMGADEVKVILKDSDSDGVPDDIDQCPDSALNPTIVIGECDTGVANEISDDGCTRQDLINDCFNTARNKGTVVMCVAHLTNGWRREGLITGNEKGKIQSCAAKVKRKMSKS